MPESYPEKYLEGIEAFNSGQYFECHEFLESLWLEVGGTLGMYYQALIQIAVAIYHLEGENLFGAISLCDAGLAKLAKVPDIYMGLDVRDFEGKVAKFFLPYRSLSRGDLIQIDRNAIPKIQLS